MIQINCRWIANEYLMAADWKILNETDNYSSRNNESSTKSNCLLRFIFLKCHDNLLREVEKASGFIGRSALLVFLFLNNFTLLLLWICLSFVISRMKITLFPPRFLWEMKAVNTKRSVLAKYIHSKHELLLNKGFLQPFLSLLYPRNMVCLFLLLVLLLLVKSPLFFPTLHLKQLEVLYQNYLN